MPEERPITHTNPAPASAQTSIAEQLQKLFPDGRMPDPVPLRSGELPAGHPNYRPPEGQTGPPGQTGATGYPGPSGVAGPDHSAQGATGTTGAATTGPTGESTGATGVPATTGPADAATGPTGAASGPAESGPTEAQLDAAGNKMDIKAGTAFKYVRDENAKLLKANSDLTAKLKSMEGVTGTPADANEVAELKAKVDRYEKELSISRIEATDAFQKEITKPLEKANSDLQAIIAKYQVSAGDIAAALANPDPIAGTDKLAELSANFNRLDLVRFDQLIGKISQLNERKQTEISQAADKWKAQQSKIDSEAQAASTAFEANWKGALATAAIKLDKDGFFKLTGDATRDAEITKIKSDVQNLDVAKLSNESLAESLYRAGAFPLLLNELSAALASAGEKDATIARLRSATPGPAGGGQTPPPQSGPTGVPETASFQTTIKSKLGNILPP